MPPLSSVRSRVASVVHRTPDRLRLTTHSPTTACVRAGLLIHEFVKRCLGKRNRTPNYLRKIAQYGKVVFTLFVHLLILTGAP